MTPIERIDPPSVAEFQARYVKASRPVILRGAIRDWPAVRLWSGDYFKRRYGDREVPVARARDGSLYESKSGVHFETIRIADYIDRLAPGQPIDLFMFFRIHEVLPDLFDDIVRPPYCSDVRWFRSRLWFAGPDTKSPLHRDLPENLYAQVVGHKTFVMLDKRLTRMVHRHSFLSGVPNFSPIDAEAPDLARYPRFRDAPLMVAELEPGDLFYIPSFWWHQGHSVDTSMSLSLWWTRGLMVNVARAAEQFARVRNIRI
ncbi:MAG TPA: cupin-like domain-containing protein [Candidatus Dormibacteraeota bacterium]|nr:cupin-like domain-containing protein [Candidatus Dormibacteraeota bacterium]